MTEKKEECKRTAIKQVFETFIDILETDRLDRLAEVVDPEVEAVFSTTGTSSGIEQLAANLKWKGPKLNVSRQRITNLVIRTDGDEAVQSAYVMVLVGVDNGRQLYPFEYGGKYLNTYRRTETGWKIKSIRYDLDWEKGNTYFVKDWTLIDYKIYAGHTPSICSEFDAPWRMIPESDEPLSDEEQIVETMFKYSWGLDNCDFSLHRESYVDEIQFKMPSSVVDGARNLLNNFKNTSHKEAALQHAIKIVGVKVDGSEATLDGYRIEPHRLGSKNLNRDTMHQSFYSAVYHNKFRKIDGVWKMYEINYKAGVFFETSDSAEKYVDVI